MPPAQDEPFLLNGNAAMRIESIHGAAAAAVVAVHRLASIIPLGHGDANEALSSASARLAYSIERLEQAISDRIEAPSSPFRSEKNDGGEGEKWQRRYRAVERERDQLQEMLVGLKDKYEQLQRAYNETARANDEKTLECEALHLKNLDAKHRLESSLFLIETLLRAEESANEEDFR